MRWLGRLIKIPLIILIAVWAFLFALENPQPVGLVLVPFELPSRSLGFWVLAAFVLGSIIGLLAGSSVFFQQKRRELQVRRELRDSRVALDSARHDRGKELAPAAARPDFGKTA